MRTAFLFAEPQPFQVHTILVSRETTSLRELSLLFLRLGSTSFGGPAAHIALMHEEVVIRRKWLPEARFLDLLGATNLIPGPSSTEMAIHIGYERRGFAGLVIAGVCFIVPAMLMTGALAVVYVRYGALPEANWVLYGIKPIILCVVLQALAQLWPKAAKTGFLRLLAAFSVGCTLLGAHELLVLAGSGLLAVLWGDRSSSKQEDRRAILPFAALSVVSKAATALTLPSLFWVFFKTGSLLFGSGYVLLAFLRADLVERLGWLSEKQLFDAIAIGQMTPGPVFTTATFIGYLLARANGAIVSTIGIFLPAFFFVAISGPLIPRLRSSVVVGRFLDGVNIASLALMAVVTAQLGRAALVDVPTILIMLIGAELILRRKLNSMWLVIAGAALGFMVSRFGLAWRPW